MSISLKMLVPLSLSLVIATAQAQLLPTWETHIVLTQEDLGKIHATLAEKIHGRPTGTTASWNNPTSANSGSIRLIKRLVQKNQQCEEIEYVIQSNGPPTYTEHYRFTSCLQPDGTWKIA